MISVRSCRICGNRARLRKMQTSSSFYTAMRTTRRMRTTILWNSLFRKTGMVLSGRLTLLITNIRGRLLGLGQTVRQLFHDAILYDEPLTAHAVYYALQKGLVQLDDPVSKLRFEELDFEMVY